MTSQAKSILLDSLIGAIIGFFILHPISMLIISHTMPETMPGMEQGIMGVIMESLMAHHLAMSLYFTILGASFGVVAGFLYARILRQNEELHQQKFIVQETLTEKDTLLRILSHDLTNQVGSSRETLKYVLDVRRKELPADMQELFGAMLRSLSLAIDLIGHSRTMIAVESGKIVMRPSKNEISKLIQAIISSFSPMLERKKQKCVLGGENEQVCAMVEPIIFSHSIFGNLLSNAIKFSVQGETIHITVRQAFDQAVIEIENRGLRIEPHLLDKLFSIDVKTSTLGTMGERGTGLGLPLVQKFVRLMQGAIKVACEPIEDAPGLALFRFTLAFPSPAASTKSATTIIPHAPVRSLAP